MAAAVINKTEIGVNEFGRDVEVPENPIAKLMYYFDSICYAMDMNRTASPDKIKKLRDFTKYRKLNEEERDLLLILVVRFSPDELINKCLFQDDEMCENDMNKFYKMDAVQHRFVITEEIIVGGQVTRVVKILCYRKIWLEYCYFEPMKNVERELRSLAGKMTAANQGPNTGGRGRQQTQITIRTRQQQPSAPPPPPPEKDDKCVVL